MTASLGLAAVLTCVMTPLAIRAARRFAFYDRPVGYKAHARPTPYLGGTAVIGAFAVALIAVTKERSHSTPVLVALLALVVLGTVDDRRTVSPLLRVAVEFMIGVLLSLDHIGWQFGAGGAVNAV